MDIQFQIGELVLVKLQPYRQTTIARRFNSKICRRYFGLFPIIGQAGPVAYTLGLPPGSKIHPTFHVSLLKAFKGDWLITCYPLPNYIRVNKPPLAPVAIAASRTINVRGKLVKQVLVQWSHSPLEDATWEELTSFSQLYNIPDLEDKVIFYEERSDNKGKWAGLVLNDGLVQEQLRKQAGPEAEGDINQAEINQEGKEIEKNPKEEA